MEELKALNMIWIVINPDGTYAGTPCFTWEKRESLLHRKKVGEFSILTLMKKM